MERCRGEDKELRGADETREERKGGEGGKKMWECMKERGFTEWGGRGADVCHESSSELFTLLLRVARRAGYLSWAGLINMVILAGRGSLT